MILTSDEITKLGIVRNPVAGNKRATTYDATVGEIISNGTRVDKPFYKLPKRGIVWVVSHEDFKMPTNVTGLATLRTTWTHKGVLALNVGIVDPGWCGPLATALVNFGDRDFLVRKGDTFLRILFHEHKATDAELILINRDEYVSDVEEKSKSSSDTFLSVSSLATEVYDKIFKAPMWATWAVYVGIIALLVSIIAIFFPVAYGVTSDFLASKTKVAELQGELDALKRQVASDHQIIGDHTPRTASSSQDLSKARQQPNYVAKTEQPGD